MKKELLVDESKYFTFKIPKRYVVDFDKVKDFHDLKNVVQILFSGLPVVVNENCEFIGEIREFLVEIK